MVAIYLCEREYGRRRDLARGKQVGDLLEDIDCIVLSEEFGVRKPDPAVFWHATGLLGREPEECLYVGDSYAADVVGAKKAGLPVCWFNPSGLHPAKVDVESDYEICTLVEILEILKEADKNGI